MPLAVSVFTVCLVAVFLLVVVPIVFWIVQGIVRAARGGAGGRPH